MREYLASLLLLIGASGQAADPSPWLQWVEAHSPHGFDMTPDGTIWININQPGAMDDFSVRAGDLQAARITNDRKPIFWIRGDHKRNRGVKYRSSMTRLQLNCDENWISTLNSVTYDAIGNILDSSDRVYGSIVVPGSYGDTYFTMFCIQSG